MTEGASPTRGGYGLQAASAGRLFRHVPSVGWSRIIAKWIGVSAG